MRATGISPVGRVESPVKNVSRHLSLRSRFIGAVLLLGIAGLTCTQSISSSPSTLTLPEALAMAKKNNGTVRAAYLDLEAARAGARGAYAAFLPSITPSYLRTVTQNGGNDNPFGNELQHTQGALLTLDFNVFDSGRRRIQYRQVSLQATTQESVALQAFRTVLFDVHSKYYAALQSQELLKVQEAQLKRAEQILDQTKVRVELKDAARKDILQAQADALNARASYLQTKNQVATTMNDLKAVIGWEGADSPVLQSVTEAQKPDFARLDTKQVVEQGLNLRYDLAAARANIRVQDEAVSLAKLNAGPQLSTDIQFHKSLGDNFTDSAQLKLSVTGPLYDGGASREAVRQAQFNRNSTEARYLQEYRVAKAEIESTLYEVEQDITRYEVAQAALDAAKVNFEAASEAQKLGAATLIDVLTAQVSLVTAEQNSVQALYDLLTVQVKLKLVTGQALPGETGP